MPTGKQDITIVTGELSNIKKKTKKPTLKEQNISLQLENSKLKEEIKELKSIISELRESHKRELEYCSHWDEDGYCRHCGKCSCICDMF